MAIGAIVGALITAVISAGSTAMAQEEQNKELRKAKEEDLALENQARADALENQTYNRALGRKALAQSQANWQKSYNYNARQDSLNRAEQTEGRNYQRKTDVYNRAIGMLNNNMALRDRNASLWGGK